MLDEMEARIWQQHHQAFGDQIAILFRSFWRGFKAAHAHLYDAPWRKRAS